MFLTHTLSTPGLQHGCRCTAASPGTTLRAATSRLVQERKATLVSVIKEALTHLVGHCYRTPIFYTLHVRGGVLPLLHSASGLVHLRGMCVCACACVLLSSFGDVLHVAREIRDVGPSGIFRLLEGEPRSMIRPDLHVQLHPCLYG